MVSHNYLSNRHVQTWHMFGVILSEQLPKRLGSGSVRRRSRDAWINFISAQQCQKDDSSTPNIYRCNKIKRILNWNGSTTGCLDLTSAQNLRGTKPASAASVRYPWWRGGHAKIDKPTFALLNKVQNEKTVDTITWKENRKFWGLTSRWMRPTLQGL